ncbi:putative aminotransferase TAT2 [Bienertia sinuspersici]
MGFDGVGYGGFGFDGVKSGGFGFGQGLGGVGLSRFQVGWECCLAGCVGGQDWDGHGIKVGWGKGGLGGLGWVGWFGLGWVLVSGLGWVGLGWSWWFGLGWVLVRGLSWVGLGWSRWFGLGWVLVGGLSWVGLGWSRWFGLGWVLVGGLSWVGLGWSRWFGLGWAIQPCSCKRPGFPIYQLYATFRHIEVRQFNLVPTKGWEVDLDSVQALVDENMVAIVVFNPGNPCGNVYPYQHLLRIAEIAKKLGIVVIADEVYGHLTFGKNPFVTMGTFGSIAPVLTLGSLSKRWLVPDWRLGWLAVTDPTCIFKQPKVHFTFLFSIMRFRFDYQAEPTFPTSRLKTL